MARPPSIATRKRLHADATWSGFAGKLDKSSYEHPLDNYYRLLYKELRALYHGETQVCCSPFEGDASVLLRLPSFPVTRLLADRCHVSFPTLVVATALNSIPSFLRITGVTVICYCTIGVRLGGQERRGTHEPLPDEGRRAADRPLRRGGRVGGVRLEQV